MSDQDRLAEWFHLDGTTCTAGHHADTSFCVEGHGPVMVRPVRAEIARLRDLLARLEHIDFGRGMEGCPVCFRRTLNPHTDDCWLGEELAPERKEDAPP